MINIKVSCRTVFVYSFLFLFTFISHTNESQCYQSLDTHPGFINGQKLVSRGSYPEAIDVFKEISLSSASPDIRANAVFLIGSIYESCLDLPEEAIENYKNLLFMYPESPVAQDALFNTGKIYYRNGRYREALKSFNNYISLYPEGMRLASVKTWAASASRKYRETEKPAPVTQPPVTVFNPVVRVLLLKNKASFQISGPSTLSVSTLEKGEMILETNRTITVSGKSRKLVINGSATSSESCRIAGSGEWISINGQKFRGFIAIHMDNGSLMAVNHVNVESYLYGVVPKEMSPLWEAQALEAQAIASRTYALYIKEKRSSGNSFYDLEATTSSQVYGGYAVEKESAKAAVNATKGIVLFHDNKLIISYFHANSGGKTESSLNVWGVDIPYLKSIDDSYSIDQVDQPWEYFYTFNELSRLLSGLISGGRLKRIEPQDRSPSGRILNFMLCSDTKQVKVSGNSFRLKLGPVNVKSTIFEMIPEKNGIRFRGTGYGHGVGMSQKGAQRMALTGMNRNEILKHYYSDVKIVKISYL